MTHEYRVEGPALLFLTTTAIEMDEELLNRCLVLDGRRGARSRRRRSTSCSGERQSSRGCWRGKSRHGILQVHRNAQRLLRPLLVANPFARSLTFPDDRTRTRRDHVKYLTLIRDGGAAPSVPAGGEDRRAAREGGGVHRGDAWRRGDRPIGWRTRCWGGAWTSCRRRRGGC